MNNTEKQKDIVDLKSTMNQLNVLKIFTQQQDTNSFQITVDYKLGGTGTYPGT